MSKSTQDAAPSTTTVQSTSDSVLVVGSGMSRQKKIAVVIFATLSGVFLMEERPIPNRALESDSAIFSESGLLAESKASNVAMTSAEVSLQLPPTETTDEVSVDIGLVTNNSSHVASAELSLDPTTIPQEQQNLANDFSPARPRLRFSGHIEPLY